MKAVLAALVILSSSLSFAISDEEAVLNLAVSCTIEKYCAPNTPTAIDMVFVNQKGVSESQLGLTCADVDMLFMIPGLTDGVKQLALTLQSNGIATCLSGI